MRGEQVVDAVQPRAALGIRVHHVPGGLFDVGVGEHLVLRFEYSTQRVRDSRSIGESFQRRVLSSMRA